MVNDVFLFLRYLFYLMVMRLFLFNDVFNLMMCFIF